MALHTRFHKQYEYTHPYLDVAALKAAYGTPEWAELRERMVNYSRRRIVGYVTRKQAQAHRGKIRRSFRRLIIHNDDTLYLPFRK